ncbi:hypothetical protein [Puniceibacterium sp. IMCC21224]|uniref:hypothetical protein n=1 Tax=Puniceibacterium sp. IMCC21224 TaxID=1618204 RepID=UPI00064DE99B|nr:hypothetical protein [Puniceibacterium sp. IMCC21224]KMK66514.1 hypothetical protein IMCC21224_111366 [Puniceibacterium sp. IMCC21224]
MSDGPRPRVPLFLERQTYRRRRLMDAARFLPVLGLLLWAVPLLWQSGVVASSGALIYIFGVWLTLVLAAFVLSFRLRLRGDEPGADSGAEFRGTDSGV